MARKPLDQLSPKYRQRIERALAAGKTRQAARGHRPAEHIERAARERAARNERHGLTRREREVVSRWAEARARTVRDHSQDDPGRAMVRWAESVGYDKFKRYRAAWEAERRGYQRRGSVELAPLGALELAAIELELPDVSYLYYH